VLPRVSAALTQFISPILGAAQKPSAEKQKERNGQRDAQPEAKPSQAPKLVLVKNLPEKVEPSEAVRKASSVSNAFLQIFNLLNWGKKPVLWFGYQAYRTAEMLRRSGSRFHKGTMIDKKAD
jgi:hypothetical protein